MAVAKDTQQFCVRWNSYQSNLQSAFPKLLTSEHFVDVTLACESRMVKCHKLVLSACSAYFEKLLVQNPCPHPIIFMKDMKYWEVQALVDFMYKGEVNVTQEELGTLLKAAEALEVRGLCGQQDQGLADKLSLPRDTVMAGGESQKKRKAESDTKEDLNPAKVEPGNPNGNPGGGGGGPPPPTGLITQKSPNHGQQHHDIAKMNNPTPLSAPNTNVSFYYFFFNLWLCFW
ncbi:hypothetical protein AAG570_004214 [Ranatra chinensis]|uniref:BTB domain-containing protein n=1 Tax=Ranatra chinensis TaxID=642074 RepID=A0ABD0Y366_9HEMI